MVALRAHLATAIEHARRSQRPPQSSLNALTDAQKAAPAWQLLTWDGQAVTATPRRTGDAADRLLADLAYAATDLLTDRRVTSIRRCAGPTARSCFSPTTLAGNGAHQPSVATASGWLGTTNGTTNAHSEQRQPACDAMRMALRGRRPGPGLMFHSDRGSRAVVGPNPAT